MLLEIAAVQPCIGIKNLNGSLTYCIHPLAMAGEGCLCLRSGGGLCKYTKTLNHDTILKAKRLSRIKICCEKRKNDKLDSVYIFRRKLVNID